jgi:hypothetical protein
MYLCFSAVSQCCLGTLWGSGICFVGGARNSVRAHQICVMLWFVLGPLQGKSIHHTLAAAALHSECSYISSSRCIF